MGSVRADSEPISDETKAKARVAVEMEDGDGWAIVEWPDQVFHRRYVLCLLVDGAWTTVARGWKGMFVAGKPYFLPEPEPAANWIAEKIEEARCEP